MNIKNIYLSVHDSRFYLPAQAKMQDTIQNINSVSDTILDKPLKDTLKFPADNGIVLSKPVSNPASTGKKFTPQDNIQKNLKIQDSFEINLKHDSIPPVSFIKEQKVPVILYSNPTLSSANITTNNYMHDWYFLIIVAVLIALAWIRIMYNKFLNSLFENSFNYVATSKTYNERTVIHKRVNLIFNLIYIVNGSLFLLLLSKFFKWNIIISGDFKLFTSFIGLLLSLMLLRSILMRLIGYIFNRYSLFSEFIFHFFIYNKLLGIALTPFILFIPYTLGLPRIILIYTALFVVGIIYILKIIRVIIFSIKNVVLLFYLILYLCTLEILPVLVILKLIFSMG